MERDNSPEAHAGTSGGPTHRTLRNEENDRDEHNPGMDNKDPGTATGGNCIGDGGGGGEEADMVSVDRIIEQFETVKAKELKPRTRREYTYMFSRFADFINLKKKRKRDLRKRGRKYILEFFRKELPRKSWKKAKGALRTYWEDILEMDWPLRRSDLKTKSSSGRGYTPPDSVVAQWNEALEHEPDPYVRLNWEFDGQGVRPSHKGNFRWKHILKENGKPISLVAYPDRGEFKTDQPVAMFVHPRLQQLLMDWEKEYTRLRGRSPGPEDYILPWKSRSRNRGYDWERPNNFAQDWKHREDFRKRYRLPKLTARDMRHWVATACRKAGLSKPATAYLQGHDSSGGSTMRDWYDNPSEQEAIYEQAQIIPDGPLATITKPKVKVEGDLPVGAKEIINRFLEGKMGSIEAMTELEDLKRELKENEVLKP